MFNDIAPRYDTANRVLSLGLDQWWRRQAIKALGDARSGVVLDLCAGTLDLSRMLIDAGAARVIAADFAEDMLASGKHKFTENDPIEILCTDARDLPIEDNSVDGIICGFGLRNVPELHRALGECARVLRPGGCLIVLDFFQPVGFVPRLLQGSYNKLIVPTVGGLITGFGDAYHYLNHSIDAFCTAAEFADQLQGLGFQATTRRMFPPVAHMIQGQLHDV
jgi:demethylmenaquinone methyltransferase/2-methoxy-6-polyprenyl-1,4-benzoquinol methylase